MSNFSFAKQPGAELLIGVLIAAGAGVDPSAVILGANTFLGNNGAGYAAHSITALGFQFLSDATVSAMRTRIGVELSSGQILVGNAGNTATPVTATGDITISNAGVTSIGNDKVTSAMLANMAANSLKARVLNSIGDPSDLAITANTFPARDSAGNLAAWTISDWMLNTFIFNNTAATARTALSLGDIAISTKAANATAIDFGAGLQVTGGPAVLDLLGFAAGVTRYFANGLGTDTGNNGFVCPRAGIIKNLRASTSGSPGGADSYAFTARKNSVNQSLTCTISGGSTSAADTANSFAVAAGDIINIAGVASATAANSGNVLLSVCLEAS